MTDIEKLGVFYLGREVDRASGATTETPILYDSRDLTTHAVCVGMTGSGKTGLCLALLEEAAIDGVPALVIDPKGDLGNLLLTFPELTAGDFRPWIDPAEAARKDLSPDVYAEQVAAAWRKGLAEWGQEPSRIARFRDAADVAIYTPGSAAGLQLSVLKSFAPPAAGVELDASEQRERISSVVSGLLALLNIEADPLKSREHILLSGILDEAWSNGRALDLAGLVGAVQKPAFEKVGVFDLESFFPAKVRLELALAINTLIASPAFAAWTQGEPLDVQRLLFTPAGKPRISIISIAHLADAERMFCVTLLLNEVIAWMRAQAGTSSLRAILCMDEIFGFFPPNAMPPAKLPMLTLLKQARAFGVGVVLATQNPVDLDYKGLGNAGTWFIGRLQTERDKLRVVEGLQSAQADATGALDRPKLEELLSSLSSRVFLMRNVHDDAPVLLKSRWALSYLRGPLTLKEIGSLMGPRKTSAAPAPPQKSAAPTPAARTSRPVLAADVAQYFLRPAAGSGAIEYRPQVAAFTRLHFVDARSGVDAWQEQAYTAPLTDDGREVAWDEARVYADLKARTDSGPAQGAQFAELPAPALRAASYAGWAKSLTAHLHQHARLTLFASDELKLSARVGEAEGDFRARVAQALRERRDEAVAKLREKFAARVQSLTDQIRRAQDRVAREQAQYSQQKMQSAVSIGATVLGAIFGSRRIGAGSIGRAAGAMRTTGRLGREKDDVARAEDSMEVLQQRLADLNAECEAQAAELQRASDPQSLAIRGIEVSARKADIAVGTVALLWVPWRVGADGIPAPAYEN
jgi:hypothetical protein